MKFYEKNNIFRKDVNLVLEIVILQQLKLFYEKHYYTNSWFYWVLVLETWSWIDLNWLSEKNTQLKEKNIDFTITTISDKLFKKL